MVINNNCDVMSSKSINKSINLCKVVHIVNSSLLLNSFPHDAKSDNDTKSDKNIGNKSERFGIKSDTNVNGKKVRLLIKCNTLEICPLTGKGASA